MKFYNFVDDPENKIRALFEYYKNNKIRESTFNMLIEKYLLEMKERKVEFKKDRVIVKIANHNVVFSSNEIIEKQQPDFIYHLNIAIATSSNLEDIAKIMSTEGYPLVYVDWY